MAFITIKFIGLAIHVNDSYFSNLGCKHRVILLAYDGQELHGHPIDPHSPQMGDEPLQRVSLRVLNAKSTGFTQHSSFDDRVPHLSHPVSVLIPKEDVIYNGAPPVAAYFDANDGELRACSATPGGAIGTWLKVETEGDPIIEVTNFDTNDVQQRPFSDGSVVVITDTSVEASDDEWDYLINYLVFEPTALAPLPPAEVDPLAAVEQCFVEDFPSYELTSSCSNTTFP